MGLVGPGRHRRDDIARKSRGRRDKPLAVLFRVPVLGLFRLRVRDLGGDVVVAVGLDGLGVRDLLRVDPVIRFRDVLILDLLVGEGPAVDDVALGFGVLIEEHFVRAVLLEHQGIQMRELVLVRVV